MGKCACSSCITAWPRPLPIILGAGAIGQWTSRYHLQLFVIGGLMMLSPRCLSLRYVSLIRRGERAPHPRHWQAFLAASKPVKSVRPELLN